MEEQQTAHEENSEDLADENRHLLELALVLFDSTVLLHDLGEDGRTVMEAAALMHDVPIQNRKRKAYKAALKTVNSSEFKDLTSEEQSTLAAVLACHQGKLKRKTFAQLDLSPMQQRQALTIAALLGIAVGLDASGNGDTNIIQIEPAQDGIWIVVDGPKATVDAPAAQNNSRLWSQIGYPDVKILESEDAAAEILPYPKPLERIGILPTDPLSEAGRKVMRYHFAEMLRHEEGTRLGEDIEALHDMRVATRRLRASFEVFSDAYKRGALKPHLRGLRATGRSLGSVRDLDVFMEKAQAYLDTFPEDDPQDLDPLLNSWRKQREKARQKMLTFLDSQEYATFKRKFNVFLSTPGAGARRISKQEPEPHLVRELAPVLIYSHLAYVRAYDPFVEGAPIERLHALRIEFKKLRYTVEYFKEVLDAPAAAVIEDLKKIQDHLGDLNDAQVAGDILKRFIEQWEAEQDEQSSDAPPEIADVELYLTNRQTEQDNLKDTFIEKWELFNRPVFRQNLAQAIAIL